mmetsp:Transcript_29713/g.72378  ORF Transcript_29713/g.72378 Transcript_29713/m.72378 type:complete len:349 (+) Transcript_29713:41-1087(+)
MGGSCNCGLLLPFLLSLAAVLIPAQTATSASDLPLRSTLTPSQNATLGIAVAWGERVGPGRRRGSSTAAGPDSNNPYSHLVPRYACRICTKAFKKVDHLYEHMLSHTDDRRFRCSICEKSFSRQYTLKNHETTHHSLQPYKCLNCSACFKTRSLLSRHTSIKHKPSAPRFSCKFCGKLFSQRDHLRTHEAGHDDGLAELCCKICGKTFAYRHTLRRHTLIHLKNKPFECTYCNASFVQSQSLRDHLLRHRNVTNFLCKICNKSFIRKDGYLLHKKTHTDERPFRCNICFLQFRMKHHLLIHMKSMNHNPSPENKPSNANQSIECRFCPEVFESFRLRMIHMICTHISM